MVFRTDGSRRICYMILPGGFDGEVSAYLEKAAHAYGVTMVTLACGDWNDDMTPWPAPGVFRKAKPFGGNAEEFLQELVTERIPSIEAELGVGDSQRTLAGISLSGLFAVWSSFRTAMFDSVVSISGSLWYDSFVEWMSEQEGPSGVVKACLVLGDREKNSKENRMASVEDRTVRAVEILRSKGVETGFILDSGTHFSPVAPRLEAAFAYIWKN